MEIPASSRLANLEIGTSDARVRKILGDPDEP